MDEKAEIVKRLEKWILANYRTKTEFCEKIGMSTQNLNLYISGKSGIGTKFINRLRDIGCNIEWLMTGIEESPSPAQITLEIKESDSNNFVMMEILNRVISLEKEVKDLRDEKLKTQGQTARI